MKGCVGPSDVQGVFDLRPLVAGDHGGDRFQLGVDALEAVADFGHVRLTDNHRRCGKADAGDLCGADPSGFEGDVAAQATFRVSDEGPYRFRILLRGDEVLKAVAFGNLDFVELFSSTRSMTSEARPRMASARSPMPTLFSLPASAFATSLMFSKSSTGTTSTLIGASSLSLMLLAPISPHRNAPGRPICCTSPRPEDP